MRGLADTVQLSKIRIKEQLRAALEKSAEERGVTMNVEIARRLEQSFCDDRVEGQFKEILRRLPPLEQQGMWIGNFSFPYGES